MANKGNVIVPTGIMRDGTGRSLEFREALDEVAKCCGLSCCEELIRIPDQTTGTSTEIYIDNGSLKVKIGEQVYSATLTLDQ